jgi:hypothetical protein
MRLAIFDPIWAKIIILHDWSDARFELDHLNLVPLGYCVFRCVKRSSCRPPKPTAILSILQRKALSSVHGATQPTNRHVLKETGKKTLPAPSSDSSMPPRNRRRTDQSMICSACQCDQIPMAMEQSYTVSSRTARPFRSGCFWM